MLSSRPPLRASLIGPQPFEVFQDDTALPVAAPGAANVQLRSDFAGKQTFRYRLRLLDGRKSAVVLSGSTELRGAAGLRVPAGGWYALDVAPDPVPVQSAVHRFGPFGVGERFIVAGQSYAGNHHDLLLAPQDPAGRFVAYDRGSNSWRMAHDPQPSWLLAESGTLHWEQLAQEIVGKGFVFPGGSVWPPAMDRLLQRREVPVGILSVVRSATKLADWLPGTPLFTSLLAAIRHFSPFRAILWQLGEADAGQGTPADSYVSQFLSITEGLRAEGFSPDWLIAKSTYHPAAHSNTAGQTSVRAAIDQLCAICPQAHPGPDIDVLGRSYRQVDQRSRHFTAEGQRRAGELWAEAIERYLQGFRII